MSSDWIVKGWHEAQERDSVLDDTESFLLKYAPYFADHEPKYLDWYREIDKMNSNHKLILVHPGAGKSTRLKWEAIRRITKDRHYKVAYISKSSTKAGLFMESIGKELRGNQSLINDFGTFWEHGNTWNTETIKVKGSGAEPTPTISNYGVTSQIEGMRPNLIIIDDPIDISTVLSPAECTSLEARFPNWVERLHIAPDSEMWIIGHRFTTTDLYSHIETEYAQSFETLTLEAYDEETNEVLVHEFWDFDQFTKTVLNLHRTYEIQAHYQQRLINMENCSFEWGWLENNIVEMEDVPQGKRIVTVADPAYTKDKKSDYSAAASGMEYMGGVLVTGLQHWRINSGWESTFTNFAISHGSNELDIEINNAQTLPKSTEEYINSNNLSVIVRGFKATTNKEVRIGSLEVPAKNNKIWFTRQVSQSKAFADFKAQWCSFPNISHDDLLDVIEMLKTKVMKGGAGVVFVDTGRLFG